MALPASGQISASAINTELGRASNATFSFGSAAGGTYATINTNNCVADRPAAANPDSLSEWYSYDHSRAALSVGVDDTAPAGSCSSDTTCNAVSTSVTATPSGGCASSYSYSWVYVSGDVNIVADANTNATTTFSSDVLCNSVQTATWKCTVTDGNSNTADSTNVTITLTNTQTTCA